MMIQDPAGLLQRIPELQALCEDARIRRAVEGGDPLKVYRALMWARWSGRLATHRALLQTLLRQRRLFARPLKGAPWLGTFNGFGATMLGSDESDPADGTHIATHYVVALFAIPLLPLGAYLVQQGEGNVMSRSWRFFARVPMGPLAWLWGRAVALGALLLVGLGALGAWHDTRVQEVHVVNGFNEPLEVTLAEAKATVGPRSVAVLEVPVGPQHGRAVTASGVEVDQVALQVRSDVDVLAWNVAGAAVVFRDHVVYTRNAADAEDPRTGPDALYCGQRIIEEEDVDHVFARPPETVSMGRSQREVRRTWVDFARDVPDHPRACLIVLMDTNRSAEALPFLEALARLSDWSYEATAVAVQTAMAANPAEGVRIARAALAAHPDEVDLHRIYQRAAQEAGQQDALQAEYRQRAQAAPEDATAQYLQVRLLEGRAGAEAIDDLVKRFPTDARIVRSAVYQRWVSGRWAEAVEAARSLQSLDAEAAQEVLEAHTGALVALGRHGDALALLTQTFTASTEDSTRREAAELYARVSRLAGTPAPDALIVKLEEGREEEGKLWVFRARAGLSTEGAPKLRALQLMETIGRDPAKALDLAGLLSAPEAYGLDVGTWALAYGEAVRTGSEAPQKSLGRVPMLEPNVREAFRRFVRGEAVAPEALQVQPEVRAAACAVRARNTALPEAERKALLERARREDLLHGHVSEAVATWTL